MLSITINSARALDVLVELAQHDDEPLSVAAIVAGRTFDAGAVAMVLGRLRDAGLVKSRRGPKGGFRLSRSPADITVAEIVEAIDGPLDAPRDAGALDDAFRAVMDVLTERTLAECIGRERAAHSPMYHI